MGACSDGIGPVARPIGLEGAGKYPNLIAEMLKRGWSDAEVIGLMGENFLRVLDKVDATVKSLSKKPQSEALYEKRRDIPPFQSREGL